MTTKTETQALREIIQEQAKKLATIRHTAHLALLRLYDHDLEVVQKLLIEIHTGEKQDIPMKPRQP